MKPIFFALYRKITSLGKVNQHPSETIVIGNY